MVWQLWKTIWEFLVVKHTCITGPNNPTPKRNENIPQRLVTNIYSSFIHISQNRKEPKYPSLENG